MKNKTIYMQLGDEQNAHPKEQEKEPIKDFLKDNIQDKLIDSLKILDITGNTAVVSIPLEAVKLMSAIFKELENSLENKLEQGIKR